MFHLAALIMSDNSVPVCIEQRITAEIYRRLQAQLGKDTFSLSRVKIWCNLFKQGLEHIANQADPFHPRNSAANEHIARVRTGLTVLQISKELGVRYGRVLSVYQKPIGLRKNLSCTTSHYSVASNLF